MGRGRSAAGSAGRARRCAGSWPGTPPAPDGATGPARLRRRAETQARRPKQRKLAVRLPLRAQVQARLEENHSPQQIAARLPEDFPDDLEMRVSHETIYQALYVQGRGGLRRELTTHLRTGRSLRKPRRVEGDRRGRIP